MIIIDTERMLLRELEESDVDNLLGIFADPEAMRYYPSTKDRAETEAWIRWNRESYREHGFGLWAAVLKETNEFVGQCGLVVQMVEGQRKIEIGYLFLRSFWGRGLATEAARACKDHARRLGYRRLVSLIDPHNLPSRRVAERNDMYLEREINKWNKRICVYAWNAPD